MPDNREPTGVLGLLLGVVVTMAVLLILLTGGENLGKKSVRSDSDLPPVETGRSAPAPGETTGGPATPSPNRPIVVPPPAR